MAITLRKVWKKFWEPIFHTSIIQWILAILIAVLVWAIYITCRVTVRNYDVFKQYRRKPAVFVFWHGRSLMLSPIVCLGGMRAYAMTSQHKDGQLVAKLQRLFGLRYVLGSSSKGAVSVLRQGVRVLQDGRYALCMSPDGPSGPAMRIKDGALYFAQITGCPIIPVTYSASRMHLQDRWDKFIIPMPFSRIVCSVGEPVFVPRRAGADEIEEIRKKLETTMTHQVWNLDAEFGYPNVPQDLKATQYKQMRRDARKNKRGK